MMKTLKLLLSTLFIFGLVNCTNTPTTQQGRAVASGTDWESCYNAQENRVYFTERNTQEPCTGEVFFQGQEPFYMYDPQSLADGSVVLNDNNPRTKSLPNGQKVYIGSWNDDSKISQLVALAVDLQAPEGDRIKELCRINTQWERFEVTVAGGKLKLRTRNPKSGDRTKFDIKWVDCK